MKKLTTFTKSNLMIGDIVTLRDEMQGMVLPNPNPTDQTLCLVYQGGYDLLSDWKEDLTFNSANYGVQLDTADIIRVQRPATPADMARDLWEEAPVIWEREKITTMTMEELLAFLRQVKIIDGGK